MSANNIITSILFAALAAGCSQMRVPDHGIIDIEDAPVINPDYTSVTIPPNIAPLNFEVVDSGARFITRISDKNGSEIVTEGRVVKWDESRWHRLLEQNRGNELTCEIFIADDDDDTWRRREFPIYVSTDDIDRYFSYRLIEPSFVQYNRLTLNQRDLTSFDTRVIHNNYYSPDESRISCMNCHVPRNQYRDGKTQFHVRYHNGGTIIADGDNVKRVDLTNDSIKSAGVYQAWHPTLNLIAYSINATRQYFFTHDTQKVEVLDEWSDLVLYDPEAETVEYICHTPDRLESFPAWNADGSRLYFSCAEYPDNTRPDNIIEEYDSVRYDILSIGFDKDSRRFSTVPDTVLHVSVHGKSASLPRISPDGRYMLTCVGDFGTFHIWHRSSDLWLTDLADGSTRALANANSDDVDSYHSWSSNSRWVIFSSRRGDGSYTRPYIVHIDSAGNDAKPFIVPQQSPAHYAELMKSYNVPEFMVAPFKPSRRHIIDALQGDAVKVSYKAKDN